MKTRIVASLLVMIAAESLNAQPGGGGCEDVLTSPCIGTFSRQGFFFNVVAQTSLRIDSLSTVSQGCGSRDVIVMYKAGSYIGFETDTAAWTSVDVRFYSPACTSSCPIPPTVWPQEIGVNMQDGDTVAFYVQMTSGAGSFEGENDSIEGSLVADDGNLKLFTGKAQSGLGIFTGILDTGITFQGEIYYTRTNIVTADVTPDTVCQGQAAALTASGSGLNCIWNPGGLIGTTVTVTGTTTTTYTVTAVDSAGCVDSAFVTLVVVVCGGTEDLPDHNIRVSPNPSDGRLTVQFDGESRASLIIRDMAGREVWAAPIGKGSNALTIAASPGLYLLEFSTADLHTVHRVMIR
jgi:hypothetical protein